MKKALDIVILPPENIMELTLKLNAALAQPVLKLNRHNALPHLTLAMAVVEESSEQNILAELKKLNFLSIDLVIDHTFYNQSAHHGLISGLGIQRSEALYQLHLQASAILEKYSLPIDENDASIFLNSEKIDYPKSASWVRDFQAKHSYENFDPHITIGVGDIGKLETISFEATELLLCHLGVFCSCAKVLG